MRKFLFGATFLLLTPFFMVFFLVGVIMVYQNANEFSTRQHTNDIAYAALPSSQNVLGSSISEKDGRAEKVRQFLARYGSPMEANAGDIIDAADKYGLDYRLIPAIAMQESNVCKKIPHNSYNCWGFGVYGDQVLRFKDYKEGIYTVTKALATRYKDRGLVTPNEIMTMYTPSSNGSWARSVNFFMAEME